VLPERQPPDRSRFTLEQMVISYVEASRLPLRQAARPYDLRAQQGLRGAPGEQRRASSAQKTEIAQMPNDKPDNSDHGHTIRDRLLLKAILVALPCISLHREILAVVKRGITDNSFVTPAQNFTLAELQALFMVFDRSRRMRNMLDHEDEKTIGEAFVKVFEYLGRGSVEVIEAQQTGLKTAFDILDKLRKGLQNGKNGKPNGNHSAVV
jgi:hypothetical protein